MKGYTGAVGLKNDAKLIINPATEDKQDDIITRLSSVQQPVPTNGDSLYEKDINQTTGTTIGTFSGDILSLVNDYDTEITDVSTTNPKTFTLRLNRPLITSFIDMGSATGDFSNVKILLKDLAGTTKLTIDDSSNNTKFTNNSYQFDPRGFIEVVVEFHTTDPVKINGLLIEKLRGNTSVLKALKPDGTVTFIDATAGGNLKVSVEEMEPGSGIATEEKQNTLADYQSQDVDDFTTTDVTYVGYVKGDGTWLFKKLDETGNYLVISYANVSNNGTQTTYALALTNRVTLTYETFDSITF